jgi:hypothetical protein
LEHGKTGKSEKGGKKMYVKIWYDAGNYNLIKVNQNRLTKKVKEAVKDCLVKKLAESEISLSKVMKIRGATIERVKDAEIRELKENYDFIEIENINI